MKINKNSGTVLAFLCTVVILQLFTELYWFSVSFGLKRESEYKTLEHQILVSPTKRSDEVICLVSCIRYCWCNPIFSDLIFLFEPLCEFAKIMFNIYRLLDNHCVYPFQPEEKSTFDGIFESLFPVNGLLSGDKVKPILINSKLPLDVLGKVLNSNIVVF